MSDKLSRVHFRFHWFPWHTRHGGLELSAKLHYPVPVIYANGETWMTWGIRLSLIICSVGIDLLTSSMQSHGD